MAEAHQHHHHPPLLIHLTQPTPPSRLPPTPSISSHADRDRVLDVFRDAIARHASAASAALPAMQEALKPQKQTVLMQDENQLLENGLRALLRELANAAVQAGEPVMQHGRFMAEGDDGHGLITRLLDIVLYLCERGHVEGGMVFQLLEDLTEMATVTDCKEVFGYIESKQETLGRPELFGRGKLVMLRTCNQLLRRLSKANDVVFCGRILMFLAHFFPLSERSAVNIKGVFNTSNETKYEKEPIGDGIFMDFNFYRTFWSLQEYFSNPNILLQNPAKWLTFSSSLGIVLDAFASQPLGDDEEVTSHFDEGDNTTFNIKYLTSSKLMSLELKDPNFRRHILVQCLIVFDFLKTPGKTDKESLRDALKEELKAHEQHVKRLLEITPPKGKEFLASIEHILEREQNWVWWKRDGCSPFERTVCGKKTTQESHKKRRMRWRLGNKELSQLWKWADQNPNALTDAQRVKMPPVTEYWKPLAEDMDVTAGIEAEYHHKNNRVYCWKGLRFSARQDLEGFSRFTEHGICGVVPPELLPPEIRVKQYKEKSKQRGIKKEDLKGSISHAYEAQGNLGAAVLDDGAAAVQDDDVTAAEAEAIVATNQSAGLTLEGSQKQSSGMDNPRDEPPSMAASPEVGNVVIESSPDEGALSKCQVPVADSSLVKLLESKPPRKRAHPDS